MPSGVYPRKAIKERFLEKIDRSGSCWIWTSHIIPGVGSGRGYGQFNVERKARLAHRVAYELWKGEIPKGMCVLHKCDNRKCVNPGHLFLGTNKDNSQDMVRKGRDRKALGEQNGRSVLTTKEVREIKRKLEKNMAVLRLAREFGVYYSTIVAIKNKRTWKHVK